MDFTPHLGQLRSNVIRAGEMMGSSTLVVCVRSRSLLACLIGLHPRPAQILGAATTETEGLGLVASLHPDLLVVTDRLEKGCGASLVVAVKQHHPAATRTLMLVGPDHRPNRIRKAIAAGCDGVLLESRVGQGAELTAIRSVCEGGRYIDGSFNSRQSLPCLSTRETEVLNRLAMGETNGIIAMRLVLSIDTVKSHIRNLLVKLQAQDRAHAVAIALRRGLID
jgi:DNA-binding NarL/FixJ family response regulator